MKSKKSIAVDLENKKHLYVIIGLILSLSFALNLLEWKNYRKNEITIETSFIPKLNKEPILEIKPVQIPVPLKTESTDKPSKVKIVKELPKINKIKVRAKIDTIITKNVYPIIDTFETDTLIIEPIPLDFASQMPEFPGGEKELFKFLSDNTNYPEISKSNNSQGKVLIEFVIEKNGEISNVKVLKSVDPYIDAEAIRVVKEMPKWIPGKQLNEKVRVRQRLPLKFKLSY